MASKWKNVVEQMRKANKAKKSAIGKGVAGSVVDAVKKAKAAKTPAKVPVAGIAMGAIAGQTPNKKLQKATKTVSSGGKSMTADVTLKPSTKSEFNGSAGYTKTKVPFNETERKKASAQRNAGRRK